MTDALDQVSADAVAMQQARVDLNDANKVLRSKLSAADYDALHPSLAKAAGDLQDAEEKAKAWVAANTPTPAPPVSPPPAPTHALGVNSHDLRWAAPGSYIKPLSEAAKIGTVIRDDLAYEPGSGDYPGGFAGLASGAKSACVSDVSEFVAAARSVGLAPMVVVTTSTVLSPTFNATFAADLAALAKAVPGVGWELLNEPDAAGVDPSLYADLTKAAVPAVHDADPTAKVRVGVVSNFTPGSGGTNFLLAALGAGMVGDAISVHVYTWPGDSAPDAAMNGSGLVGPYESALAELRAKGCTLPVGITETGWQSTDANANPSMTEALQAQYLTTFVGEVAAMADQPDVLLVYELTDGDGTFGLMTANYAAEKPSFTALAALRRGV